MRALVLAAAVVAWSSAAAANVTLRNGNFYVTYVDLSFPKGGRWTVERTYNSKAGFSGIFGVGWGYEWAVSLTEMSDGTVSVIENGGGSENLFLRPGSDPADVEHAVEDIVKAKARGDATLTGTALNTYVQRLRTDARVRHDEWTRLHRAGSLPAREVPIGVRLESQRFGYQYVVRVGDGWIRHRRGHVDHFDARGRLVRTTDDSGNYAEVLRDDKDRIATIVDNLGQRADFTYDTDGHVTSIRSDGKTAEYRYADGTLVFSRDVDGHANQYAWSGARFNLIRIGYEDGTDAEVTYGEQEALEQVQGVKGNDGTLTSLEYSNVDPAVLTYWRRLTTWRAGKRVGNARVDYEELVGDKGERWVHRIVIDVGGHKFDRTYTTKCGQPTHVERDGEVMDYVYDGEGRLARKETDTTVYEFTRNGFARIDTVVKRRRARRGEPLSEALRVNYQYDGNGRLLSAKTSAGRSVVLEYDRNGVVIGAMLDGRHVPAAEVDDAPLVLENLGSTKRGINLQTEQLDKRGLNLGVCVDTTSLSELRPAGVDLDL